MQAIQDTWTRVSVQSKRKFLGRLMAFVSVVMAALLAVLHPVAAQAQPVQSTGQKSEGPVTIKLSQWKVVTDDKKQESFADASSIKPGEIIEYRAVYTNVSKKSVKGLAAVLPIPEGLEYIPDSSKPGTPAAEAATKDGRYAAQPLVREVKGKDGKQHTERVPYYEYRSLRWSVGDLVAGKTFEVKARARVGTSQPDVEPQAAQAPPRGSVSPTSVSAAK